MMGSPVRVRASALLPKRFSGVLPAPRERASSECFKLNAPSEHGCRGSLAWADVQALRARRKRVEDDSASWRVVVLTRRTSRNRVMGFRALGPPSTLPTTERTRRSPPRSPSAPNLAALHPASTRHLHPRRAKAAPAEKAPARSQRGRPPAEAAEAVKRLTCAGRTL
jgi:hypothetical protein